MNWLVSTAVWIKRNWHQPEGLGVITALAFAGLLAVWPVAQLPAPWLLISLFLIVALITGIWAIARRTSRVDRNKIGLVVAISLEPEVSPLLRTDFIGALRETLSSELSAQPFQLIEVRNDIAERILGAEDARRLRMKLRAQFVLFGRVRHRKLADGVDHEILDLLGLVGHGDIGEEQRRTLKNEFSELLPRRFQMKSSESFEAIEFTGRWAGLIAKYIIGLAAGMSGRIDVAEILFREVQSRITVADQGVLFYAKIRERIPKHLEEIAFLRARAACARWYRSKDDVELSEVELHLARASENGFDGPGFRILNAIVSVHRTRSTSTARRLLNGISKKLRDAIWHLNVAFLDAFDHDIRSAAQHYRRALNLGIPPADVDVTVGQVEHFLLWQLEVDPSLIEMHFCLGFVNLYLKGDIESAQRDFDKFLEVCPPGTYDDEKKLIKKWIAETKPDGAASDRD